MSSYSQRVYEELDELLKKLKFKGTYTFMLDSVFYWAEEQIEHTIVELEKLKKSIDKAYSKNQEKIYDFLNGVVLAEIQNKFGDEAVDILVKNAEKALSTMGSTEYNIPEWREQLISAIKNNPSMIMMYSTIEGNLSVSIDPQYYIGRIEDYGNIVTAVRNKLAYGNDPHAHPERASRAWRMAYRVAREGATWTRSSVKKGLDATARTPATLKKAMEKAEAFYWEVMNARLSEMENEAPFWYILEHGNTGLKLSSDKGGFAYPIVIPTRFVRISELEIKQKIKVTFDAEASKLDNSLLKRKREVEEKYSTVIQAISTLRWIKEEVQQRVIREQEINRRVGMELLREERIRDDFRKRVESVKAKIQVTIPKPEDITIDSQKALDARVNKMLANLSTGAIPPGKRVSLGYVQGKRIQKRTMQLYRELTASFSELGDNNQDLIARTLSGIAAEVQTLNDEHFAAVKKRKATRVKK